MSYSVFVTPDYLLSAKINNSGELEPIYNRKKGYAAACSKLPGKPLEVRRVDKLAKSSFYYSSLLLGLDNLPQGYDNPFVSKVEDFFNKVLTKNTENCAYGKKEDKEKIAPIEVFKYLVNKALETRNGNDNIALIIPDQYRQQQRQMIVNAFPDDNIFLIHQSVAAAYDPGFSGEKIVLTVRLDDGPLQVAVHKQNNSGLQTLASLTDATLSGLLIIYNHYLSNADYDERDFYEFHCDVINVIFEDNELDEICEDHRVIICAAIQQCLAMADCDLQDIDQVVLSGNLGERIEGIRQCVTNYTKKEVVIRGDEELTFNALYLMDKQRKEPRYLKQCLQSFMTIQVQNEMRAISNLFQSFPSQHEKMERFLISDTADETLHVMENSLYDSTIQRNCQLSLAKAINHDNIAILKFSVAIDFNGIISLGIMTNDMDIQPREAITFA